LERAAALRSALEKQCEDFFRDVWPIEIPVLFRIGDDCCDPSNDAPFQPHLDPVGVGDRSGQDRVYNPTRSSAAALVFFLNNIDGYANLQ